MAQFMAHMKQCDAQQLAPADWLNLLEEGAEVFMEKNAVTGRPRDAVVQYIDGKASGAPKSPA